MPVRRSRREEREETREKESGEMEVEQGRERIFVGGLGESVTEDDLQRLFTGVGGSVDGIDVIRTKGRSFAYVDFLPCSDKSLSKLFATYNGCVWKGGKLKLHKAKEHYLVRLRREWAEQENAQLAAEIKHHTTPQEAKTASQQHSTKQLRLFFPALRTVKALPFSGTGKHKYSFQRVQVPSLPLHFCDCEEHAVFDPSPHQQNQLPDHVINDKELSIMNKVMDKLLQKELEHVSDDADHNTTASPLPLPSQQHRELHFPTEAEAEEDDLIINIVSSKHEDNILSALEELRSSGTQVCSKINGPPNKKRKSLLNKNYNEIESEPDIPGAKTDSKSQPDKPELGVQQSTAPASWSQKCSWRQLVGHRDNSGFSVSHILTGRSSSSDQMEPKSGSSDVHQSEDLASDGNSEGQLSEMEPLKGRSEHKPTKSVSDSYESGRVPSWHQELSLTQLTDENTGSVTEQAQPNSGSGAFEVPHSDSKYQDLARDGNLEGQLCEMEPVEENAEPQPQNALSNSTKSGRGASWRQKSSWTQLINDNTGSSFSITQVLPAGISFKQQGFQKPRGVDVMSSFGSKLKETVKQDKNKLTRGESSSLGIIGKEGDGLPRSTPKENQQIIAGNDNAPDLGKICDLTPKQASTGTVDKGKTRLFVRSAASLNEWAKAKAALSGSRKRKNSNK